MWSSLYSAHNEHNPFWFMCLFSAGGENHWFTWDLVLWTSVHWQQRLQHLAETGQKGEIGIVVFFHFRRIVNFGGETFPLVVLRRRYGQYCYTQVINTEAVCLKMKWCHCFSWAEWNSTIVSLNQLPAYLHSYFTQAYPGLSPFFMGLKSLTVGKECIPLICRYNRSSVFAVTAVFVPLHAVWSHLDVVLFDQNMVNLVWTSTASPSQPSPTKVKLLCVPEAAHDPSGPINNRLKLLYCCSHWPCQDCFVPVQNQNGRSTLWAHGALWSSWIAFLPNKLIIKLWKQRKCHMFHQCT